MNPYSYYNIFDTKGIEYLIVIGFLVLLIPFWRWLNSPVELKSASAEAVKALTAQILRIPKGLLYSMNHTWTHLERSGMALVGMDDLLLHLTGGVEVRFLKEHHERIGKGEPVATLSQDGKQLQVLSPISGVVKQTRHSLEENPGSLLEDPYGSWLVKIQPEQWQKETGGYIMGEEAERWAADELGRFREFMTRAAGMKERATHLVMQAGGELIDQPLKGMDKEVWEEFQEIFLGHEV
jgi:glycine cleavage system H protein